MADLRSDGGRFGNRQSSIGTASYVYDADGDLTTDGRRGLSLTYNLLGMPASVTALIGGVGATVAATGAVIAGFSMLLAVNASNNASKGYQRGNEQSGRNSSKIEVQHTSINQLNRLIHKGKAPRVIKRFDTPKVRGEQKHVHFDDGSALNFDGSWKHGHKELDKETIIFFEKAWI